MVLLFLPLFSFKQNLQYDELHQFHFILMFMCCHGHQCIPSVTLPVRRGIYVMFVAFQNKAWHREKKARTLMSLLAWAGILVMIYSDHVDVTSEDVVFKKTNMVHTSILTKESKQIPLLGSMLTFYYLHSIFQEMGEHVFLQLWHWIILVSRKIMVP